MKPQLATNASKIRGEINQLRLVDVIDEFTFARLQHEVEKLSKIDLFHAYLLRGALDALKHDMNGIRENHQAALKLATISEDRAVVLQNHASALGWNGYFSEAAKLAIEGYDIFPTAHYAQQVVEHSVAAGLFHHAANFMRQYPQKLQYNDYSFFFQVEQFMDQHGVSDGSLQQLIEMAVAVLHKHEFFNLHSSRVSEKLIEDESKQCFCYTIKVKGSMAELIDLNYELAREIAKSGLPTSLTSNFVPMYEQESYLISHDSHAVILPSQQEYETLSQSTLQQPCADGMCESGTLDFKTVLLAMPNVGEDEDFGRTMDMGRDVELST